jgi:uncharacterized protein
MVMPDQEDDMAQRNRMSELDVDTCLTLLGSHHFGRIAVNDGHGPIVLPVNYVLDQGSVLFRTDEGTKLAAATDRERATFQVDHVDEAHRVGWSVMVRGKVTEVTDADELERIRELPLDPFAGGERPRYVRMLSAAITGRRVDIPEGLPAGWLKAGDLGHLWFDRDAGDLGL